MPVASGLELLLGEWLLKAPLPDAFQEKRSHTLGLRTTPCAVCHLRWLRYDQCSRKRREKVDNRSVMDYVDLHNHYENIFSITDKKTTKCLSWTHYSITLQMKDAGAHSWHENETANEM